MVAYLALYRQWRPKTFTEVVGQKGIMDTLRNQVITGRVAHAYLFCGSRGTGKTSTAKILARAINCENPEDGNPCGICESCQRLEKEESLDVIEIDAASNNGVDEIRDLRETVKYPPQTGKYKVYIIDEVHMLSASAFNALLKTLEEPPAFVVFILATTEPQKLPATILSRCQRYDFGRLSIQEMQGRLKEAADGAKAEATPGALMLIARAAEGGMRDALGILDMCISYRRKVDETLVHEVLGTSDRGFLFAFDEALSREEPGQVFNLINELMKNGKEPAVFAKDISSHFRNLLMAACCPDEIQKALDLTEEDAGEYIAHAKGFSLSRLMSILDLFMSLETELRYASSPRLALENTSLKCCLRTEDVDVLALNDRISELERKLDRISSGPTVALATADSSSTAQSAVPVKQAHLTKEKPGVKPRDSEPQTDITPSSAWKEALQKLKRTDPGIYGILSQGTFAGVSGNCYEWQATKGGDFFATSLNTPEKQKKIADALTASVGTLCEFRARTAIEGVHSSEKSSQVPDSFLGELSNAFGANSVHVVDSLPT